MSTLHQPRTLKEEITNSIIHGIALAIGIGGIATLIVFACLRGTASHIVGCSIYGGTLIILFLSSTLYHGFQKPHKKRIFKIIDHCSIYLFIAGTYTPFTLVNLKGGWGWTLFGLIWGFAILGILSELFLKAKHRFLSSTIYLMMGWLVIIAIKPLFASMPLAGCLLLVAGGLSYTVGVIFYVNDKIPYFHSIWHLWVLAGSVFHFFSILFYVVPLK